ncbi:Osmoprotectant-binding protein [uncultured Roseburia sp.]|uniref:Glycine/betaine ABC transporter substrate-binding protein n=1 Tax=Brotonthovivens ammoniilytica TaxID=2981725 RepID=A0ABT2TLP9_9FIRM|nr:glycine betaine ABC transporter substrate-binding protein [Brotonthovivens ammoniilytica]MCU6763147.1 glycine/betaine ABC transporter substrate-binding protein [Brotonthovivens ammoniilytica]SCJ04780.1 Osmoprotectant-binding protein [uncultured Roseburia sp.]
MKKRILCILLAAAAAVSLTACQSGKKDDAESKKIIVGSKGFTENLILSELYALALEDEGFEVQREFEVSNAVIHQAVCQGDIDIYPEYTGTALMTILEQPMMTDTQEVYNTVKEMYAQKYQLDVLEMCAASDGNGLAMRADVAQKYGIRTISDLQKQAGKIRFGSTSDFYEREDGMAGLKKAYGEFAFASENSFDNALKYQVLESDEVDCVPAYTTDAQLSSDEFVLLEDDKKFWPPYNIIPVVRADVLEKYPEAENIINHISQQIDTETMTELNAAVDIQKEEYDDVAADFYETLK